MKIRQCTLDNFELLSTVPTADPLHAKLSLALASVEKRSRFCYLHYHEVMRCTGDYKLELERAGLSFTDGGNVYENRTYYEANIFAFFQNIHAVCDSFPYIVFLMLGPLQYLDKKEISKSIHKSNCGWSENFFNALRQTYPTQTKLHRKLKLFLHDKDFQVLKGLVNQSKHQHLPRILNNITQLNFEKIEYLNKPVGGKEVAATNIGVEEFMRKCNNKLVPKLLILLWTLHLARIDSLR